MSPFLAKFAVLAALVCVPAAGVSAQELMPDVDLAGGNGGGMWWATDNVELSDRPGEVCAKVPGGTAKPWDAIVGINGLSINAGERYRLTADLSGDPAGPIRILVQASSEPWMPQSDVSRGLSGETQLDMVFTAETTLDRAQLAFQLGGSTKPWRFCIRRVSIKAGAPPAERIAGNPIRLNQLGYLPDGPKRATLVRRDITPAEWQLVSEDGAKLASGMTRPLAFDMSSELDVQAIDFSDFQKPGKGYRLVVDGEQSHPFSISRDLYAELGREAMSWFYPMRSGVAIEGTVAGAAYARPAGHVDVAPNTGDTAVGCLPARASKAIYGVPWTCDYRLDVSGGWYDAGDFGKYVVNGGIAVAQLMGTYERALNRGRPGAPELADGVLSIPEAGNGIPDILDEARWELDFLLAMQVPAGKPYAGMAHHKVHGARWTTGPVLPSQDPEQRVLHRPSTAATLNLAAAAAQGARLFGRYDQAYAARLLGAAQRAFEAAEAEPSLYAPLTNGSHGGGDYDDSSVSDEFYWAAAELYLTTGGNRWLKRLKESEHWKGSVFSAEGFSWKSVAALARLELASVPSELSKADLSAIQETVIAAADGYLAVQSNEAFGLMYNPPGGFGWGSNQSLLQNMIVTAVAYDISGKARYLSGLRESMDYLLGRNAVGISYVTGYGTVFAHRQFSNMFAHALDPSFPEPPRGSLAGGPNSQPADDAAKAALAGCAPQACYIDDPRAYSVNEIAINWNAPLGWVAAFLAETD